MPAVGIHHWRQQNHTFALYSGQCVSGRSRMIHSYRLASSKGQPVIAARLPIWGCSRISLRCGRGETYCGCSTSFLERQLWRPHSMHWRAEERPVRSVLHHFSPALVTLTTPEPAAYESYHWSSWVSHGKPSRVEPAAGRDSLPVGAVITPGIFKSMIHSKWGLLSPV